VDGLIDGHGRHGPQLMVDVSAQRADAIRRPHDAHAARPHAIASDRFLPQLFEEYNLGHGT